MQKIRDIFYLQLIGSTLNNRNREQEVAECSRKLKALARSIKCPVIVSSQLNRQAEDQTTQPDLRHLRESGAIEQDADLVLIELQVYLNVIFHDKEDFQNAIKKELFSFYCQ